MRRRILPALLPLLLGALAAGCDPAWTHRVKVSRAPCETPDVPAAPLAGATVRVDCAGMKEPFSRIAVTNDAGEAAFGGLGYGIPRGCTVEVSREGFAPRRYHVADLCSGAALEREKGPEDLCRFGVLHAELVALEQERAVAPSPSPMAPPPTPSPPPEKAPATACQGQTSRSTLTVTPQSPRFQLWLVGCEGGRVELLAQQPNGEEARQIASGFGDIGVEDTSGREPPCVGISSEDGSGERYCWRGGRYRPVK